MRLRPLLIVYSISIPHYPNPVRVLHLSSLLRLCLSKPRNALQINIKLARCFNFKALTLTPSHTLHPNPRLSPYPKDQPAHGALSSKDRALGDRGHARVTSEIRSGFRWGPRRASTPTRLFGGDNSERGNTTYFFAKQLVSNDLGTQIRARQVTPPTVANSDSFLLFTVLDDESHWKGQEIVCGRSRRLISLRGA